MSCTKRGPRFLGLYAKRCTGFATFLRDVFLFTVLLEHRFFDVANARHHIMQARFRFLFSSRFQTPESFLKAVVPSGEYDLTTWRCFYGCRIVHIKSFIRPNGRITDHGRIPGVHQMPRILFIPTRIFIFSE